MKSPASPTLGPTESDQFVPDFDLEKFDPDDFTVEVLFDKMFSFIEEEPLKDDSEFERFSFFSFLFSFSLFFFSYLFLLSFSTQN